MEKLESKPKADFDKYFYYYESVQSPETDVEFFRDAYKELKGRLPETLREDFCGTFAICCEWARLNKSFKAVGVDLDPEPVEYGKAHYLTQLTDEEQSRVDIRLENVLNPELPKADVTVAVNFSYFIFKKRQELLTYFKNALDSLKDDGLFMVDCFGGSQCQEPNEEKTKHDSHNYYWDQDYFDPVGNHGVFYIHFKPKGGTKHKKVFTYDWRMWSIPEVRDIMEEAGFKKTHIYWEGTEDDGEGDGEFKRVEKGEDCDSWVAYIVGDKQKI